MEEARLLITRLWGGNGWVLVKLVHVCHVSRQLVTLESGVEYL